MTVDLVPDRRWHRGRHGTTLVAGSPATFFRVTSTGAAILDAIETGSALPRGHESLTDRLVFAGAAHSLAGEPPGPDEVTVVVPARVDSRGRGALAELALALSPLRVVVVDDASPEPIALDDDDGRVRVVRLGSNAGPGAARNRGLAGVGTDLVAFVDSDVVVRADDVLRLCAWLHHERVVAAAPRVTGLPGRGILARHEVVSCPLDMGPDPSWVRPGARVRYVPSAVLVVRTDAARAVGGFDESLRYGEDVDLVWRLRTAGGLVRHDPSVTALHRSRTGLRGFLAQRTGYGSSAAPLARRHGADLAPYRSTIPAFVAAGAFLSGWPAHGAIGLVLLATWRAWRVSRLGASVRAAVGIAATSVRGSVVHLAAAVTRSWLPLVAFAGIVTRRALWVLAISLLVRIVSTTRSSRPRDLPASAVLVLAGDVAYCVGVWKGIVSERSVRCVLPVLTWRRSREH